MRALICILLAVSSFLSVATGQATQQPVIIDSIRRDYPDCGVSTYYGDKDETTWTRQDLHDLLKKSHRNALSVDAVFQALIELDQTAGAPGFVDLIYSAESVPAADYGQPDTWTREQLWPDSRGAVGRFAFTDVHNSRPENTRVTAIKKEMLYGECGTVEFADVCEKPAFTGGSATGEQDGKVWAPPENMRGDIARALFYMDVRYDDKDHNLNLTDCPPYVGKMGVLSQLLEWHAADPPSNEEAARNQNACRYWQGNRNPFVDYPDLVAKFYGQPQQIAPGSRTYPSCLNIPTPSPTAEMNDCDELQPGDVFIYVVESDDPDGVGFMALEDIPGGLELYMTDNAWTGTAFLTTEGVVKLTVPPGGYKAGEQFGFGFDFGANQKWVREEGEFNVGTMGDSVILYCYLGDSSIRPLVAYTNNNEWSPPGLTAADYGSQKSALPDELKTVGNVHLAHLDNYKYEGPQVGDKKQLQEFMMKIENWKGTDEGLGDQDGSQAFSRRATMTTLIALVIAMSYYTHW